MKNSFAVKSILIALFAGISFVGVASASSGGVAVTSSNSGVVSSGATLKVIKNTSSIVTTNFKSVDISYQLFDKNGKLVYSTGGVITGSWAVPVKSVEFDAKSNRLFLKLDNSRNELIDKKMNAYKKELNVNNSDERRELIYKGLQTLYAKKLEEETKVITVKVGLTSGGYALYMTERGSDVSTVNFLLPKKQNIKYIEVNWVKFK